MCSYWLYVIPALFSLYVLRICLGRVPWRRSNIWKQSTVQASCGCGTHIPLLHHVLLQGSREMGIIQGKFRWNSGNQNFSCPWLVQHNLWRCYVTDISSCVVDSWSDLAALHQTWGSPSNFKPELNQRNQSFWFSLLDFMCMSARSNRFEILASPFRVLGCALMGSFYPLLIHGSA